LTQFTSNRGWILLDHNAAASAARKWWEMAKTSRNVKTALRHIRKKWTVTFGLAFGQSSSLKSRWTIAN
jgi:hypothetical protein